jgi:hypothetical protein
MFAGTASPDDLDTYLTGAPYDVVVDLTSGSAARTRHVPGTQQPPPPAGQTFWVTQSEGAAPSISTALGPGDALVVLNADASPGVHADVVVTYSLAKAWTGAWIAVGTGVVAVLLAVLAFWRASVARRRREAAKAAESAAAATALTAAAAPATVLPDAPLAAEPTPVPAWAAAAPGSLGGDELSGPPTGSLVVDPASDGSAAVVAATIAPERTSAEPEAGWYPVATSDAEAHDIPSGDEEAVAADSDDTPEPPASSSPDAPDAADDPSGASAQGSTDDPVYDELSSWFRDDASGTEGDAAPAR